MHIYHSFPTAKLTIEQIGKNEVNQQRIGQSVRHQEKLQFLKQQV